MILRIPHVLCADQVADVRSRLQTASWVDGRVTAGEQSRLAKANLQLAEDDPLARGLGAEVLQALAGNRRFMSAALPLRIFPPLFSLYCDGMGFSDHVDNAIRRPPHGGPPCRTDLSATLFLSDPDAYDGGELCFREGLEERRVRLPAGGLVLYPATTVHRVTPVTRGVRLAGVFWVQSLVAETGRRDLLFELDSAVADVRRDLGDAHSAAVRLVGIYHNLVRGWAQT